MQDGRKAVWSIPYVSVSFFPSLKENFIAYLSSKLSDCIFEIDQLRQSGFSWVYSNSCCNSSFESEIMKIGQSSHKMDSNSELNFQESTTILNACTKKSGNLLKAPRISSMLISSYIFDSYIFLYFRCLYLLISSTLISSYIFYAYIFLYLLCLYLPISSMLISSYIFYAFKKSKAGDHCRGWPEGSLFDSYYTMVMGRALLLRWIAPLYRWPVTYNAEC